MQKWEYNVDKFSAHSGNFNQLNNKMDEFGREGWEMVSVTYEAEEDEHSCVCIFKRPFTPEVEFAEPRVTSLG
jgi:Domain of unknown function (DUF4177)